MKNRELVIALRKEQEKLIDKYGVWLMINLIAENDNNQQIDVKCPQHINLEKKIAKGFNLIARESQENIDVSRWLEKNKI